jgi:hypothetical protein
VPHFPPKLSNGLDTDGTLFSPMIAGEQPSLSLFSGSWFRASAMIILNKIPTRCSLVLKSLKTSFYFYSVRHVSDTTVSIIRSFLIAAHAVSGHRVVLGRLCPAALLCDYCRESGSSNRLWVTYATHSTLKPVPTLPR